MSLARSPDELKRIELVENSFEKIKPQANEFVASFYKNLFEAHPEAQPLFKKTDMSKQGQKLLNSLVLLVENIRQPDVLKPVLKDLGARHKGYGTLPEYYPAVGEALLTTFAQYLKEEWTAETQEAWIETYQVITEIMLEGAGATVQPETVKLIVSTPVEKVVVYLEKPEVKPQIVAVPAVQLSEQSRIELVESSFDKIKPQANEFVVSFYQNLFETHPEAQPLFKTTDMSKQGQKLLNALVLLVENIRQPDVLKPVLKDLGARHKGYGTLPEYYPAVGEALLTTFAQYLKEEWTAETQEAWIETYQVITQIMLEGAGATVQPETVKLIVSTPVEKVVVYLEKPEVKPQIVAVPAVQLSEQSRIELVESSFEKIKPEANEFVASFYDNLFKENPETEPLFDKTDIKKQHKKLLNSLVLLVENIRQPQVLKPVLKDLGARHKGYGTLPEYYPAVGQALLTTFAQYLQQDWTAETEQAWVETYEVITQLMIEGATQVSTPAEIKEQKETAKAQAQKASKSFVKIFNFADLFNPQKRLSDSYQSINDKVQDSFNKLLNIFWELPTGVVAGGSALVLIAFILLVEENEDSILAKILNQLETLSLLIALVLYIKEIPERRKESHYQAWSTIDAAKGVNVSYARIMALQDLNEDGIPLRGLDAVDADLTAINLPKADLSSSNLTKAILKEANLSRANFDKALLARADLSGANLSHANFSFAKLSYVNFSLANLNHANLICADLRQAQMSGADLQGAQLSGANLDGAYLTGANLKGANVSQFDLRSAYLKGAIMPDGSKHP